MSSRYYYADPTGNITLLAPVPSGNISLSAYASRLMTLEPTAQQVGFLSRGGEGFDITLQMAGNEFCGNATLSAAAVFSMNSGSLSDLVAQKTVLVRVSGAASPVPVMIRREAGNLFSGMVSMPAPQSITSLSYESDGEQCTYPVVVFEGITHILSFHSLKRETAEAMVLQLCSKLNADALGIMQIDSEAKTLLPLVYVPGSSTLFWEGSCASGTTAVGAYLLQKYGPGCWEFQEPAGSLSIEATADGHLLLNGKVSIEERCADF